MEDPAELPDMYSDLRIPKTYRVQELYASHRLSRNPTDPVEKQHHSRETMAQQVTESILTAYQTEPRKQQSKAF
jgi:hypothetical protein